MIWEFIGKVTVAILAGWTGGIVINVILDIIGEQRGKK